MPLTATLEKIKAYQEKVEKGKITSDGLDPCPRCKLDHHMVDASELSDRRLIRLEAVIGIYRQDFYAVGRALSDIRDGRHYQKLSFGTFERYVNVRWDMSKSHAYRLIEAFSVIDNLSPIGDILPRNEAQARPLTRLDPHSQRKAWRDFLKTQKPISTLNIKRSISLDEQKQPSRFIEVIPGEQMSEKCPECPLFSHDHCRDLHNPKLCAIVREDRTCLRVQDKARKCTCPCRGKTHTLRFFRSGTGTPRKFCPACRVYGQLISAAE